LLESASQFLHTVHPEILLYGDNCLAGNYRDAYELLQSRFPFSIYSTADFRQMLVAVMSQVRKDGNLEPMTLITTDTMLFCSAINLRDAFVALSDQNVLGVNLTISPVRGSIGRKYREEQASYYDCQWDGVYEPFSYGAIYRTGDVLGAMTLREWDSPETLLAALGSDPALRRRSRMACFSQLSLMNCHCGDEEDILHSHLMAYNNGMILDIDKLKSDTEHYHWKSY
jgi:hypothetical protein